MLAHKGRPWIAVVHSRKMASAVPPAVATELERRGRSARIIRDGDPAMLEAESVLLMGSLGSLRRTARLLKRNKAKQPFVVAWVSEPLPPPGIPSWALELSQAASPLHLGTVWAKPLLHFFNYPLHLLINHFALPAELRSEFGASAVRFLLENLAFLRLGLRDGWINAVAVSTEQKRLFLAGLGVESSFVPVGQQAGFGRLLDLDRDIDVLFIGNVKSRRRRHKLEAVFAELRKRGVTAYIPQDPIHGEERTKLVNRARIMLNLHNFPWDTPWMRWNLAIANGAVVASEPLSVPQPLRPGNDYLSAPIDALPDAIEALLKDEKRRATMLANCRAMVDREMTLPISVGRMCDILDAAGRESKADD